MGKNKRTKTNNFFKSLQSSFNNNIIAHLMNLYHGNQLSTIVVRKTHTKNKQKEDK